MERSHTDKDCRVAVITGASRGLGYAFAQQLLKLNYRVGICSSSQKHLADAHHTLISESQKDRVFSLTTDMTKESQVENFFDNVVSRFGRIDLVINNVGYLKVTKFENLLVDDWSKTIDLNLKTCFLGCHFAFKHMLNQPGTKHILNISSLSGIRFIQKFPGMSAYIASKHAIIGLTESLAVEGKEHNIHVNCLAPGSIDTKMFNDNFPQHQASSSCDKVVNAGLKLCTDHNENAISGCVIEMISDTL